MFYMKLTHYKTLVFMYYSPVYYLLNNFDTDVIIKLSAVLHCKKIT